MGKEKNTPKGVNEWRCTCEKCGKYNNIKLPRGLFPKYCMNCGNKIPYSKTGVRG